MRYDIGIDRTLWRLVGELRENPGPSDQRSDSSNAAPEVAREPRQASDGGTRATKRDEHQSDGPSRKNRACEEGPVRHVIEDAQGRDRAWPPFQVAHHVRDAVILE